VKTAVALSRLAIAWNAIAERARILRGRPLPGSLMPERARPKRKHPFIAMPTEDNTTTQVTSYAVEGGPLTEPTEDMAPASSEPQRPWAPAASASVVAELPQPEPAPVAARPLERCPVCHGAATIRISGGNTMVCPTCGGSGRRHKQVPENRFVAPSRTVSVSSPTCWVCGGRGGSPCQRRVHGPGQVCLGQASRRPADISVDE
jgi:hypothetical protein